MSAYHHPKPSAAARSQHLHTGSAVFRAGTEVSLAMPWLGGRTMRGVIRGDSHGGSAPRQSRYAVYRSDSRADDFAGAFQGRDAAGKPYLIDGNTI